MGGIGRCCCTCDCLPIEDLPTVTISGHTGNGWAGDCCYEQTFTPDVTPSWSKGCSSNVYAATVTEECVTKHYRLKTPDYRGYELFPGGCDTLPQDHCCPEGEELVATSTTEWYFANSAFMAVWTRPKHIIVRISQEEVDCEGIEGQVGGCKIVIRSRYVFESKSKIYESNQTESSQAIVIESPDCFEVNPDWVWDNALTAAFDCDDVPSTPPDSPLLENCLFSADFYFDRVKYYDTMPSGEITFGNADVPGCDASSCDYSPYNYTSSACIYSPSGPINNLTCIFNEPCYCVEDVNQVNDSQTITFTCGESVDILEIGDCNADPCIPALCTTLITTCDNRTPYDCPYSLTWSDLQFDIDPENPATCINEGIGTNEYNACGGYYAIEGIGVVEPPYYRTDDCFAGNCDANCCRSFDDCPCCLPDGNCPPLYAIQYYASVETHTREQTCSGLSSQSVCTSAPSWTINLA